MRLSYTSDGVPFYEPDEGEQSVTNPLYPQVSVQPSNLPLPVQQPVFEQPQQPIQQPIQQEQPQYIPVDHDPWEAAASRVTRKYENRNMASIQPTSPMDQLFTAEDRFQTWPEKMIRSAVTLGHDVMSGTVPTQLGLRREDFTDIPPPTREDVGNRFFTPIANQPNDAIVERAQDVAGMAGGTMFGIKPGVGSMGSGPLMKMGEQMTETLAKAKDYFGITNNPREADYVLPDGTMLDLSGRHQDLHTYEKSGNRFVPKQGERDYMRDARNVDHRELTDIYPDNIGSKSGLELMQNFMAEGAVRNMPGIGFDVVKMPTEKQLTKLIVSHNSAYRGEPLKVDVSDLKGDVIASKEFEKPNVNGVKEWLSTTLSDTGTPGAPLAALANQAKAPTFYSAVEHAVNNIPQAKMPAEQWLGTLSNKPGVKPEELDWIGLKDFLADKKGQTVTKQEVQDFVNANRVELKEIHKPEPENKKLYEEEGYGEYDTSEDQPKYHSYQLPGGENYREMLLTLPQQSKQKFINEYQKKTGVDISTYTDEQISRLRNQAEGLVSDTQYKSSHWDEPNVLAHVRMNDRTIDGKKSLHIEEIQSDWHQQGRDKGYNKSETELSKQREEIEKRFENGELTQEEFQDELRHLGGVTGKVLSGVPDAPFKKSWHELALKRMIREAAEVSHKNEVANWEKLVHTDTDTLAHKLVKDGVLKEICE